MLDHSIEELREFVNNYRLNNNNEGHTSNGMIKQYSNDELIKLLESDTSNMEYKQEAENCTEKTAGNDSESQNDFNVLKVKDNGVKGLTVEVRENLYSKFNTALSINYKTTFRNQNMTLTDANICNIAKKIEFSIFSIATDLNYYKLSGAEKVVNIEKQTCNRNLCEALRAEIELLKLREQIEMFESKDNPQQPSSVVTVEAETKSQQKSQCQDDQSNTDIAVNSGDGKSVNMPTVGILASESDQYFSCSSSDHSPTEFQQDNQSCTSNSNTQNPVVGVPEEKISKETELTNVENCQTVSTTKISYECNNNNCSEKITTETNNLLSEIHSNNGKDKSHLASTEGVSLNKKRKRKSKSDEESAIQDNKENRDLMNHATDSRMANSPSSKKHKTTSSEATTETPDSTTSSETYPLNCMPLIENIKLEPVDIKSERFSPPPNIAECTFYSKETVSLENSLSNEIPDERCDSLGCNEKEIRSDETIGLQAKVIKSEVISKDQSVNVVVKVNRKVRCRITRELDLSIYSPCCHPKEDFDKQMDDIVLKIENASSVDVDSSNVLNDNTVLPNPELNSENDALLSSDTSPCNGQDTEMIAVGGSNSSHVDANNDHHKNNVVERTCLINEEASELERTRLDTSPCSGQDTDMIAVGGSNTSDVDANNDHHENNAVVKKTCLIDEEAFELERARLDKEYEEMKKRTEESENRDFIYGDHQRIFEIIIPIIREYYPSDYIPEEWSYGKILQRLQIDLAETEMSDEEMASYTRDSIKTMRYLCDHCIVQ